MTGPMLGYMVSAYTLTKFIEPSLTPTITNEDPRWIGAWWMGQYANQKQIVKSIKLIL